MKKVRSINNFFAQCLIEDRFRTSEFELKDFFIEEKPCVVETRGCVDIIDGCVNFAVFRAQPIGLVESQVVKDSKPVR